MRVPDVPYYHKVVVFIRHRCMTLHLHVWTRPQFMLGERFRGTSLRWVYPWFYLYFVVVFPASNSDMICDRYFECWTPVQGDVCRAKGRGVSDVLWTVEFGIREARRQKKHDKIEYKLGKHLPNPAETLLANLGMSSCLFTRWNRRIP